MSNQTPLKCDEKMNNSLNPSHADVLTANRDVHKRESAIYDTYHSEIFNRYEKNRLQCDIVKICSLLADRQEIRMLDIGCGTGNISLRFIGDPRFKITALDISKEMIDMFRQKLRPGDTVKLMQSSIEAYLDSKPPSFDLITINSVLHHLYQPYDVFQKLTKILNARGVLYIAHEPLSKNLCRNTIASRCINLADRILSHLYWLYKFKRIIRIDHTVSDFQRDGIDIEQLKTIMTPRFHIHCDTFCAINRTGIATFIENRYLKTWNSFRFIAQKCSL
jgi:2-polyprenyl-3-methyl-5-hydroxy-6-metoxy-1,4-benzoquinol methylase